jgi:hydroxymethylpyrimidine pyrophosphatase-like HAD family hydrolase
MSCSIKLFACDLDDTLLKNDLSVDKYDKEMLKLLQNIGVKVVLCSGRICFSIKKKFEEIGLDAENTYLVGMGGCEIVKASTMENIYKKTLSLKTLSVIIDYCK